MQNNSTTETPLTGMSSEIPTDDVTCKNRKIQKPKKKQKWPFPTIVAVGAITVFLIMASVWHISGVKDEEVRLFYNTDDKKSVDITKWMEFTGNAPQWWKKLCMLSASCQSDSPAFSCRGTILTAEKSGDGIVTLSSGWNFGHPVTAEIPASSYAEIDSIRTKESIISLSTANPEITLEVICGPDDAYTKSGFTMTSADPSVVTCDGNMIRMKHAGDTSIKVVSNDFPDHFTTVTVHTKEIPERVEMADIPALVPGDRSPIQLYVTPQALQDKEFQYLSSDPKVIQVGDGSLLAVAPGDATVTVADESGIKAVQSVHVCTVPNSIAVEDIRVKEDETASVIVSAEPSDAEAGKLYSYSIDDNRIASVSEDGIVRGITEGETTLTVENELGQTAQCAIIVTK